MDEPVVREGRVIKSYGSRFVVVTAEGTFDCGLRGRMRISGAKTHTPVAVGDRVQVTVEDPPYGVIDSVHPRVNKLSRPDVLKPEWEQVLVANCDQLIAVASLARPRLKFGAVDRLLLVAEKTGLDGAVVLNKIDLVEPHGGERARHVYNKAGYPVVVTSALTGEGLPQLREVVQLKVSIFAGHSGVGKSSLLNALEPGLGLRTREVSEATERGTHTTTSIELHPLGFGGYIADTPGLRAIGLWDLTAEELPGLYRDFRPYLGQCRFGNCLHVGEPDCAIREAVAGGSISTERYEGYLRIRQSLVDPEPLRR
ncbi:MAG: ribosome small subunit-dependent GTPase A [Candidatus Zixiibacteriota bacterium]